MWDICTAGTKFWDKTYRVQECKEVHLEQSLPVIDTHFGDGPDWTKNPGVQHQGVQATSACSGEPDGSFTRRTLGNVTKHYLNLFWCGGFDYLQFITEQVDSDDHSPKSSLAQKLLDNTQSDASAGPCDYATQMALVYRRIILFREGGLHSLSRHVE